MLTDMSSHPTKSGIYKITNTANGKCYIGCAVNIKKRFYEHKWALTRGEHGNPHLQAAWQKYGEEAFEFSVIELVEDPAQLLDVETVHIQGSDPELVYNILNAPRSTSLGLRRTPEVRRKTSEAVSRHFEDPENRRKTSEATRAGMADPEVRRRISEAKAGKIPDANQFGVSYIVRLPSGETTEAMNLSAFCREHGLQTANAHQSMLTKRILPSGFAFRKKEEGERRDFDDYKVTKTKKRFRVTHLSGAEFITDNVRAFCREHNTHSNYLYLSLRTGKFVCGYKMEEV